jgi:hypothetical protein
MPAELGTLGILVDCVCNHFLLLFFLLDSFLKTFGETLGFGLGVTGTGLVRKQKKGLGRGVS